MPSQKFSLAAEMKPKRNKIVISENVLYEIASILSNCNKMLVDVHKIHLEIINLQYFFKQFWNTGPSCYLI